MSEISVSEILMEPAVAYAATGNRLDLVTLSRKGIKKEGLLKLAKILQLSIKEIAALLPVTERTLQRRDPGSRLSPAVSEQVILITELTGEGSQVFGGIKPFVQWLKEENTALGGQKPLALLDTAIGIQLITDQLGKLQYGVYS